MAEARVAYRPTGRRAYELFMVVGALALGLAAYALVGLGRQAKVPANIVAVGLLFALLFGAAHTANRMLAPRAHGLLLGLTVLLNTIGYAIVSRLDPKLAANQAVWMVVGVAAYVGTLWLARDYRTLDRFRYTLMFLGLVLLLSPLSPFGLEINGSRLWLDLGPLSFQPGEMAKVLLIVFFASYLAERAELLATATHRVGPLWLPAFRHFGPVLLAWGASLAVLFFERDLGQSLLLFAIFMAMLWVATGRSAYLIIGILLFAVGAVIGYAVFTHVQVRVQIWRHPFADPKGDGYQLLQSIFALAAGGVGGSGLGRGSPDFIPFAATDFIFSAVGEELGLLGGTALLISYLLLVGSGLRAALRVAEPFGKLLAVGVAFSIGLQAFVVVGGVSRLVPVTGITLPLLSYGGSSLVSTYVMVAMLVAISHAGAPESVSRP